MGPEQQGPATPIPAAGAVPKPAPPEQLNLEAGKHQANQEMADAEVSEQQLAQSNEPDFQQALTDKKTAAAHADTAPGEFRKQEQDVISQSKTEAAAETKAGVTGMQGAKGAALAKLVADKGKTKSKDEAKRAEVTAKIQDIFARTEVDVKKILEGIDKNVEKEFERGEKGARAVFESYVSAKMSAYKKDRYSGWLGGYRWLRDKVRGMPSKVNEFYEAGRELYLKQMDKVIGGVANIVGTELTAAKTRIAAGKTEIASYVKSLPANLKKVGAEASKEIADKFEQLEEDVNSKQESVVDTLATKYVEARKGLDERIEELQAENKGLIDKAIGAIKAIINTIRQLASMLMNVLARVAGVVGDIIKAPVRFLGNLIDGVKGGILKFKDNILDHLRKGLMSWLFGALAEGGVELPDKFDPPGIIKLLASLFGLTWRNIRNRIVKQIGEKAMVAIEKGVEIFQIISGPAGVAGLWQMLMEKLGDIKEMILDQVKDFVITRIITAGITWLIGLLNPAAAFIKACKLIYDVIMFFVNNAERIAKFVNTVIDSAADIVRGNIGGVVAKIEDVLSQMVPILIGFLASVIGIGGIGQKIREIIGKLQKPVTKAIDFVIKTGLKLAGPIIRGLKGIGSKVKAKVAAGKAYVKGKVEAGKKWVKEKAEAGRAWVKGTAGAGAKGKDGPPGKPDAKADGKAERPQVSIPFEMAGAGHTIKLTPSTTGVAVTMSSEPELPLTKQYSTAHKAIDNFRHYMNSIKDPEVRKKFEAEVAPMITVFQGPSVEQFKAVYAKFFPKGSERELRKDQQKPAADQVRPLRDEAEKLLAELKAWAAKTGIQELTAEAFDKTISTEGQRIWREHWEAAKARIDEIVAKYSFQGKPVEYRGSAQKGYRTAAKGKTHFDARDFDVDAFVVHEELYKKMVGRRPDRELNGKVFPDPDDETFELVKISGKLSAELSAAFPDVARVEKTVVVLRRQKPAS
jgi:hypothetical protein